MTWVKLDDTFAQDPRLERAGPLALALHVAALCYCAQHLTDGEVPRGIARRLLDLDDPSTVAKSLVEVGMWAETDDGFAIVDYFPNQRSRGDVLAERERKAAAGRLGGKASGVTRRSKSESEAKQGASGLVEPPTRPDPTQDTTTSARVPDEPQHVGADLVVVVDESVPSKLRPDAGRLTTACDRLAVDGWTVDELRAWITRQDWSRASGPGLVINRLDGLRPADRRTRSRAPQRAPGVAACGNGYPIGVDGTCCPNPDSHAEAS